MSIEDFENALRSRLAGEIGGREAVMIGWNWNRLLKTRKYNEMIKFTRQENDTSRLIVVTDVVGLERFFKDEQIEVVIRPYLKLTREKNRDVIDFTGQVEIACTNWNRIL